MAGVVAASTHAPLTAIMIVFEMTSDYALVLPLMLCGAIAYITARRLYPHSIYSEWLVRRGEEIHAGRDTAILGRLRVGDVFNRNPTVVSESATVAQILDAMGTSRQIEFPVLDEQLHLLGMITHADLRAVLTDSERIAPIVLAGDLVNPQFEAVTPNDTLHDALQRLAVRGSHDIPVVADGDSSRLVGVIGRVEILNAYDREVMRGR
jgi:CIC family chloride channel protein